LAVRPTRVRRLRIRQATRAATALIILVMGSLAYLAISKQVTLVVDGRPEAIRTMSANVGQLLVGEGIDLAAGLSVEPPPATQLADGMTVTVDSLAELRAVAGRTSGVGVWVVEGITGPWSKIAGQLVEGSPSASGAGNTSVVAVRAVVMGKVHDVLTNAATSEELLSAMGITPDADDRVQPSPRTPLHDGSLIRFDRVRVATRNVDKPIPFTVGTTTTGAVAPGVIRVVQHGVDGMLRTTYQIRFVNGRAVSRVVLDRRVLQEAVPEQREVGRAATNGGDGDGDGDGGSQFGEASWYDTPWDGLTAAHPWLPFGTDVKVTNMVTGESVVVVINDRGPFGGRIIDLSDEAFARLAPLGQGVMQVRLSW
jgi:resuscitation-promoting factor RpfB